MYSDVLVQLVPRFETFFIKKNNEKTSKFTIEKKMHQVVRIHWKKTIGHHCWILLFWHNMKQNFINHFLLRNLILKNKIIILHLNAQKKYYDIALIKNN